MQTNMAAFICEHNDSEVSETVGVGICIGVLLTAEGPMNMVLWERERTPSPSFHSPSEINWLGLYESNDDEYDDDDNDGEENEVETPNEESIAAQSEEGIVVVDDGDFSDATVVSENDSNPSEQANL